MSKTVYYGGNSDVRKILRSTIVAAGLPDPGIDLVWNKFTGFRLDMPDATAAYLLAALPNEFSVAGTSFADIFGAAQALGGVRIPQLKNIPITVYGHSLTTPAGWHSTGNHWTTKLPTVGDTGALTNYGVGGTKMEYQQLFVDGSVAGGLSGAADWGDPAAATLCLVDCVLNNSTALTTMAGIMAGVDAAFIRNSLKEAVRTLAVRVLSSRIGNVAAGNMVYSGTWTTLADQWAFSPAGWRYASALNAAVTWTPAATGYAWLMLPMYNVDYTPDPSGCLISVTVNGVERFNGQAHPKTKLPATSSAVDSPDYAKRAIPLGIVTAGQPVVVTNLVAGQTILFDGFCQIGTKHHISFVKDFSRMNNPTYPQFNNVDFIKSLNLAVDEVMAEINAIAPNGMSVVDLDQFDDIDWQGARGQRMSWSGDTTHPNDFGQSWMLAKITQELRRVLPWTTRLHII